jgi:hypothetical protein
VNVGSWHNPAAPATGQPVRLLGYFDLISGVLPVSAVQWAIVQSRAADS